MTVERLAGACFCIFVASSAAAAGQQMTETTRSGSAGREVVVETSHARDPQGRLTPNQETVSETLRTTPNLEQTKHDVFEIGADGKRRLLTTIESVRETLANGNTNVVHNTWAPDLNGRLVLASRQTEQIGSTATGVHQTETTLLAADSNGVLRETERTQTTEHEVKPGLLRHDSTHLVRDVNGRWQPIETRSSDVRTTGASESIEEETIQRPDRNGRMAVSERNVTQRFNQKNEDHVVVDSYEQFADGRFRNDNRLMLSMRVHRTTTATAGGGRYTVEEVEARSPVAPNDPMQVVGRTITTVRPVGSGRWVAEQQLFERDVNGRLQLVSR